MALFIIPPQGKQPHEAMGFGNGYSHIRVYEELQNAINEARNGDSIFEVTDSKLIGKMSFKEFKQEAPNTR